MNAKTIRYQQVVEGYTTRVTNAILSGMAEYPIIMGVTSENPFLRLIKLPSPQKCGTETQKRTYARLKAQEIVEDLKRTSDILNYATFNG